MNVLLPVTIGLLFTAGVYLLLSPSTVRLLFGLVLLGNATNLLVFTCARTVRGRAPIVTDGQYSLTPPFADPLGQALVLTAIVIGFAVLAFAMVLVRRGYEVLGSDDTDATVESDQSDLKEETR